MRLINWVQFSWDLAALPETLPELPEHYQISAATPDDEKELRRVVIASFALDPDWNTTMQEVLQTVEGWLRDTLEKSADACLVLRHGTRIIGGSVLSLEADAVNHLLPGPCVLMEYRNRGFGTHLLGRSLATLRDSGLQRAAAIAKENSPVAKFLYTKFDGTASSEDASPMMAA
jgi:N-acetylglutamate synthase-like GNAT family acetyltransferase